MNAETTAASGFAARVAAIPGELAVRLALRLDAAVTGANGVALPGPRRRARRTARDLGRP